MSTSRTEPDKDLVSFWNTFFFPRAFAEATANRALASERASMWNTCVVGTLWPAHRGALIAASMRIPAVNEEETLTKNETWLIWKLGAQFGDLMERLHPDAEDDTSGEEREQAYADARALWLRLKALRAVTTSEAVGPPSDY